MKRKKHISHRETVRRREQSWAAQKAIVVPDSVPRYTTGLDPGIGLDRNVIRLVPVPLGYRMQEP